MPQDPSRRLAGNKNVSIIIISTFGIRVSTNVYAINLQCELRKLLPKLFWNKIKLKFNPCNNKLEISTANHFDGILLTHVQHNNT